MKNYLHLFVLLAFVTVGCNEIVNEPEIDPEQKSNVDYTSDLRTFFPTDIGDKFSFNIDTLNVMTNSFENIGTRLVSVDNMGLGEESNIFICNETHTIFNNTYNSQSKFSITENSIEFLADSSGVAELIPDSIEIDIQIIFDKLFKLVEFPYLDKEEFQVFEAGANYGTFKFNVLNIVGSYAGSEILSLQGFESDIETQKFEYKINVNIPDMSNPFVSNIQLYKANVWFAPTIGIAKLEGCKMFIDPISGGSFDIADSNKVVRQTLSSYN